MQKFGPEDFDIFSDSVIQLENQEETTKNASAWDVVLEIDYEKLKKYIQFQVNIIDTVNKSSTSTIKDFKNCNLDDFKS